MEYRAFGQTGMRLSVVGLGGLLARYEGFCGHPPPEEKRRIYLRSAELGINLSLGGQWLGWEEQARADWTGATEETVVQLSPEGDHLRSYLDLIYPIVSGPWRELAEPGEAVPRTERAVSWVLGNQKVSSVLVAFASVAELEETIGPGTFA